MAPNAQIVRNSFKLWASWITKIQLIS